MKLKELVDVNNLWLKRAVGASVMFGVCFLAVTALHYMKVDQSLALEFGSFILFMVTSVVVLLGFLFYSLFMMSEMTKSIIISHRVLSQIVENSDSRFVKLYLLDVRDNLVHPVLKQHKRYDLIEAYGEELERIRLKLHTKLHSLVNDRGAQQQCQAAYDKVAELTTWKLKNRPNPELLPNNINEIEETMFLAGKHQNNMVVY